MGVFTGSDDYQQEEQMSAREEVLFCETIVKAQRAEPQMDLHPHVVAFVQLLAGAFVLL